MVLALLAGLGSPAGAASLEPSAAELAEAIETGERSVTSADFGVEWRRESDAESVIVLTPFYRVALAARHAAFRGKRLSPREAQRVAGEERGRLVVVAHLHGQRPDFARFYAPRLVVGEREIKPSFVQNEHTAAAAAGGYLARCRYGFPIRDLTGASRIVLVVADGDGRDVRRFGVDLAAMR